MTRTTAALLALWLVPATALAQGDIGLDLTQPEEKPQEESTPAEGSDGSDPTQGESLPTPQAPAAPTPPSKDPAPTQGERDIIQDDRVKSVQRKVYLKKNRFELSPAFGFSVNDPYYQKWSVTGRAAYYLADTLALALRGGVVRLVQTDDVRTAKREFQSRIFFSVPKWLAMGDVEWSPLYGKFSIFNSILHFDGYVVGGMGVINTKTSADPEIGLHLGFDLGVGFRFVAKDYMAVNVALLNTSYVDKPTGTTKGATQNMMMLNAGISLFLPFKSTGRESE